MTTSMPLVRGAGTSLFVILAWTPAALADYKDDIGYTALKAELGAAAPTGAGIGVSMAEAPWEGGSENYAPDPNDADFAGKTITRRSGSATVSLHATVVGYHLFGASSIAPGVTQIDSYSSSNWRSSSLDTVSTSAPDVQLGQVQNHSWSSTSPSFASDTLRRLDYAINRDGFTATVSARNWDLTGNAPSHNPWLAHSYNAIVVGLTSGRHSRGYTHTDGSGRVKPDIVAPLSATSFAAPTVGAAAVLLRESAGNTSSPTNAGQPETIKSILMAGATKTEFDGAWDRTTTRPLDDVYGAGELNIQRSHHIMMAGEQNASSSSTVPSMGWDFGVTAASDALYFFDVLPNTQITELSALLTWNRIVSPGSSWLSMDTTLANLDLRLYQANNFTLGSLLDQSLSTVDNVEHIYLDDILNPGRYALEVSSNMLNYEYGLAWHSTTIAVPEPSGVALVAIAAGALMRRRRR